MTRRRVMKDKPSKEDVPWHEDDAPPDPISELAAACLVAVVDTCASRGLVLGLHDKTLIHVRLLTMLEIRRQAEPEFVAWLKKYTEPTAAEINFSAGPGSEIPRPESGEHGPGPVTDSRAEGGP